MMKHASAQISIFLKYCVYFPKMIMNNGGISYYCLVTNSKQVCMVTQSVWTLKTLRNQTFIINPVCLSQAQQTQWSHLFRWIQAETSQALYFRESDNYLCLCKSLVDGDQFIVPIKIKRDNDRHIRLIIFESCIHCDFLIVNAIKFLRVCYTVYW